MPIDAPTLYRLRDSWTDIQDLLIAAIDADCGGAAILRAGGVTEGGKAGASKDDRRKIAGHARERQTEKYERDQVEAFRRTMQSKAKYRAKNET